MLFVLQFTITRSPVVVNPSYTVPLALHNIQQFSTKLIKCCINTLQLLGEDQNKEYQDLLGQQRLAVPQIFADPNRPSTRRSLGSEFSSFLLLPYFCNVSTVQRIFYPTYFLQLSWNSNTLNTSIGCASTSGLLIPASFRASCHSEGNPYGTVSFYAHASIAIPHNRQLHYISRAPYGRNCMEYLPLFVHLDFFIRVLVSHYSQITYYTDLSLRPCLSIQGGQCACTLRWYRHKKGGKKITHFIPAHWYTCFAITPLNQKSKCWLQNERE